jgi:hypothetical protein
MGMDVGDLFSAYAAKGQLKKATTPEEAIVAIKSYLKTHPFKAST